jgi:hypothetical protein
MKDLSLNILHAIQGGNTEAALDLEITSITSETSDEQLKTLAAELIVGFPNTTEEEIFEKLKLQRDGFVVAL